MRIAMVKIENEEMRNELSKSGFTLASEIGWKMEKELTDFDKKNFTIEVR